MKPTTQTHKTWVILALLTVMGVMSLFASDNFLPSLPYIAIALHAPSELSKLTIGLYLLGLCGSTLIYGPLSDYFGRRPIILIGYGIFIVGCVLTTMTHSITQLLIGRFIQACGIGAGTALFRAIMRDVFAGHRLAKIGSYLGMIFAVIPPLAPITGGYMQAHFGWRANFSILLILGLVITIFLAFSLPETLTAENKRARSVKEILKTYASLLTHRQFIGYTACASLAFTNIVTYVTVSPFLFQHSLNLTPVEFGWLSPFSAVGYLIGTFSNVKLLNYYSPQQLIKNASCIMFAGAILMLSLALFGFFNIAVIVGPLMLIAFANGFVFSNSFAGAFEPFPQSAGTTGALYSSIQMLTAGIASSLASLIPTHNQVYLALMMVAISLLVIANVYWVLRLKTTQTS